MFLTGIYKFENTTLKGSLLQDWVLRLGTYLIYQWGNCRQNDKSVNVIFPGKKLYKYIGEDEI